MRDVWVRGAAMTRFTKHEAGARELVEEAVGAALRDAGVERRQVEAAFVGNASAGIMSGQESVRGQVVLRRTGLLGVPIVNVENACASSATAMHLAWEAVAGAMYDCVLVAGYEKTDPRDRQKDGRAMNATMDLEEAAELFGSDRRRMGNLYMDVMGTSRQFSRELMSLLSVKNRYHGSLNERAHHRDPVTVEQVLASPVVSGALTRLMCTQLTDGAACLVLSSSAVDHERPARVRVAASVLLSGRGDDMRRPSAVGAAARQAYELSAAGPEDLDVIEVHDGTALAELYLYRELGLCREGEEERLLHERAAWLGGRRPVNPSGGLLARGHPVGATGAAQLVELTWQLEGRCGARQVPAARLAMAQIAGGWIGSDVAASCVHVLQV
jgi:acetyl-CoA acetyltransferase